MRAELGTILFVVSEFLLLHPNARAQTREGCTGCDPHSIVARFAPDVVIPPPELARPGVEFTLRPEEFSRMPEGLLERLHEAGVESFSTLAANWRYVSPEDTLDILGERKELLDFKDIYRLNLRDDRDACEAIEVLERSREVVVAQCNHLLEPMSFPVDPPNDPDYPKQWHLNNTGQIEGGLPCDPAIDLNAPEAWQISHLAGSPIAIVDDGINALSPDVGPFIAPYPVSKNFSTSDPTNWGDGGHGTPVAAIAAARGNNSNQIAGMANLHGSDPQGLLVALRVQCGTCFPPQNITSARVSDALSHLASYPEIQISNHSYINAQEPWKNCWDDITLRGAFRNSYYSGNSLIASAGNHQFCTGTGCGVWSPDTCFAFPAAYDDFCLAVTAVSCSGERVYSNQVGGSFVDIAAPGGAEGTTWTIGPLGQTIGGFCCTSASAPMVCGVASLMLGLNGNLTNDDVYGILKHSTEPLSGLGPTDVGTGLLKADQALKWLSPPYHVEHATITNVALTNTTDLGEDVVTLRNVPGTGAPTDTWTDYRVRKYRVVRSGVLKNPLPVPVKFHIAWVRGRATFGAPDIGPGMNKRYDHLAWAGHADLLSLTPAGVGTFETYTYKIYDLNSGQFLCWYPFKPNVADPEVCASSHSFAISYGAVYTVDIAPQGESVPSPPPVGSIEAAPFITSEGTLVLRLALDSPARVSVVLYDVTGRLVTRLCDSEFLGQGSRELSWQVGDIVDARGVYVMSIDFDSDAGSTGKLSRRVVMGRR